MTVAMNPIASGNKNDSHFCYMTSGAATSTTIATGSSDVQIILDTVITGNGANYDTDNAADIVNYCANTPSWVKYVKLMGRIAVSGVTSASELNIRFLRDRGNGTFASPAESHYSTYYVTDASGNLITFYAFTPKIAVNRSQSPNFAERWALYASNSGLNPVTTAFGTENWMHIEYFAS